MRKIVLVLAAFLGTASACKTYPAVKQSVVDCAAKDMQNAEAKIIANVEAALLSGPDSWRERVASIASYVTGEFQSQAANNGLDVVRCAVEDELARTVSKTTSYLTPEQLQEREAVRDRSLTWLREHP